MKHDKLERHSLHFNSLHGWQSPRWGASKLLNMGRSAVGLMKTTLNIQNKHVGGDNTDREEIDKVLGLKGLLNLRLNFFSLCILLAWKAVHIPPPQTVKPSCVKG